MRSTLRPFAGQLCSITLASAVPASWVAAALAASLYEPSEANALALTMGVMALLAGVAASILMARDLARMLDDLATEADMLSRERPLAHLHPAVREFAAIADGLAAAALRQHQARARRAVADALRHQAEAALELAQRAAERGTWRWDLATGAMQWSAACTLMFRTAGDGAPSRARLVALAHPSSRAALVGWLALLARGDEAAPLEFRITRGDGATRTIGATATVEYDEHEEAIAIAGSFEDRGADRGVAPSSPVANDVNAVLQALAAKLRQRAREAGIDFGAAIMPELGPLPHPALATALALLGESALTFTPRGSRVLLRADPDAAGGLSIALACQRPAAADGIEIAGTMVELNCGTRAAKRIEEARALVAPFGGTVAVARTTPGGETVTILLPGGAHAARKAA